MIEEKFVRGKRRKYKIKEFLESNLERAGFSDIEINKTPVGVKIIIYSSKPGLVVGRGGGNIKELQNQLEEDFDLESPVLEVREVEKPELDAQIMAKRIANNLAKYGASRFKGIGYKTLEKIMDAGAIGAEIRMSGKVPGSRSRSWRFYEGYLPKCGQVANDKVEKAFESKLLKPGVVGVKVRILPSGVRMPDDVVEVSEEEEAKVEEGEDKELEEKAKKEEGVDENSEESEEKEGETGEDSEEEKPEQESEQEEFEESEEKSKKDSEGEE